MSKSDYLKGRELAQKMMKNERVEMPQNFSDELAKGYHDRLDLAYCSMPSHEQAMLGGER